MKLKRHRRLLGMLAVALLALGCATTCVVPALAAGGSASSTATPSNPAPEVGDSILVTVNIDVSGVVAPDNALGSFTGTLDWNPAVLAYDSDSGIQSGFTGLVNTTDAGAGHIVFTGVNIAGATGDVVVLTITLQVIGAGSSALDLGYSAMSAAGTFVSLLPLLAVSNGQVVVGAVPYNLTVAVDPAGAGTTYPAVGVHTYAGGAVVNVTAISGSAYRFDHWSGACSGSGACQVTMSADLTVTAHFAGLPLACYDLILSHAGQGSEPVADPASSPGCPPGRYLEGETISLTGAVANAGWQISGWTGTSQDSSTGSSNSLSMPASAHSVSVMYRETIELPVILGDAGRLDAGPSATPIAATEAVAASAAVANAQSADSTPAATPPGEIDREPDAQSPTPDQAAIETPEVVDPSPAEPQSAKSENGPPQASTTPEATVRPLIADTSRSGGDDSNLDAQGSPVDGTPTTDVRRSWTPPLALVIIALIVLGAAVVVVISAVHLIKDKSATGE